MSLKNCDLPPVSRKRLNIQGYNNYTDKDLAGFKFGIRMAYFLCAVLVLLGLILNNTTLLIVAASFAFLGVFPPYHPFDYLYNYVVRHAIGKPKIPPRTPQVRFACGLATLWLAVIVVLFYNGYFIEGYIFGGIMVALATLVSTTDICIPSMIYNAIFAGKKR